MKQLLFKNFVRTLPREVKYIMKEVKQWEGVKMKLSRQGDIEFRLDGDIFGILNSNGMLYLPFTDSIKNELKKEHKAFNHHNLPASHWVSWLADSPDELHNALWLLELSYWYQASNLIGHPLDDHNFMFTRTTVSRGLKRLRLSPAISAAIQA